MFVSIEKKSSRAAARAADLVDLILEFATLGEYGLEYTEPVLSAAPQKHREQRRPCRPGRTRVDLPGWGDRPAHRVPGVQPGRRHKAETAQRHRPTSALPEALRPPRIRINAA